MANKTLAFVKEKENNVICGKGKIMKEMFDPEFYRKLPVLPDMTLLECKSYLLSMDVMKELLESVIKEKGWKNAVTHIHFLASDRRIECSDEMTYGEWLKLEGFISVDIGEGGSKAKQKEPELT